jgi:hypothetical protein
MADHSHDETETISQYMDYKQHEKTWATFTNLIKWGSMACVVLVLALYVFINP